MMSQTVDRNKRGAGKNSSADTKIVELVSATQAGPLKMRLKRHSTSRPVSGCNMSWEGL